MNPKKNLRSIAALAIALTALPSRANVNFNLIPEVGTPQFAIDGFTAAANMWSSSFADNITVNIQIGFSSLGPGIIGQAGSDFREYTYSQVTSALGAHRVSGDDYSSYAALQPGTSFNRLINHTSNNPNGPNSGALYVDSMNRVGMTTANAKVLGLPVLGSPIDALIRFSSDFSFDFDRSDGIGAFQIDFIGAAAHEIGHSLGFVSGVDDIDTSGGAAPGENFSSNLIDLFRYSTGSIAAGAGYTDYSADNRAKYFSVDGGITQIAPFANGVVNGDGNQASHWKDSLGIGIMDPTVGYGEQIDISTNDRRLFDVLGYTLVPEPGSGAMIALGLLAIASRFRRSVS